MLLALFAPWYYAAVLYFAIARKIRGGKRRNRNADMTERGVSNKFSEVGMKKNIAALVLGIIGAVCGVIGGIVWAACADSCAGMVIGGGAATIYLVGFILLGIGGAVFSLVGCIQAFAFKGGRLALSIVGLLMETACLILECLFIRGFAFGLSLWTLLAIVLLLIETVFAAKKP